MSSKAFSGVGAIFRRWSGAAWVSLGEINDIRGPGLTRDVTDVTSLNSTDGYKEFIAGFRDSGTVVFGMNFVREDYDVMKADFESNTLQNYEVVLPDADKTSFEFVGLVTELPLTIGADKVTTEVTIKISGKVTVNSGSGS